MAPKKDSGKQLMIPKQHKKRQHNQQVSGVSDSESDENRTQPRSKKSKPKSNSNRPNPTPFESQSFHPWFEKLDEKEFERMLSYTKKTHEPERTIDFRSIRSIDGGSERVRAHLFEPWVCLFEIHEPSYKELTVEFLSTFSFPARFHTSPFDQADAIKFQLGGVRRSLSVQQWAEILGLYTEREIRSPVWTNALTTWPETMDKPKRVAFWEKIATTPPSSPPPLRHLPHLTINPLHLKWYLIAKLLKLKTQPFDSYTVLFQTPSIIAMKVKAMSLILIFSYSTV